MKLLQAPCRAWIPPDVRPAQTHLRSRPATRQQEQRDAEADPRAGDPQDQPQWLGPCMRSDRSQKKRSHDTNGGRYVGVTAASGPPPA
jgi:hypothetical protein